MPVALSNAAYIKSCFKKIDLEFRVQPGIVGVCDSPAYIPTKLISATASIKGLVELETNSL